MMYNPGVGEGNSVLKDVIHKSIETYMQCTLCITKQSDEGRVAKKNPPVTQQAHSSIELAYKIISMADH